MSKTSFTFLVHGESGVGKTTLLGSAPPPTLILDLEGRARYIPFGPKVTWDPRTENPPQADGSWTHCIATTTDFKDLERAYQWLQTGRHGFRSVCVDSLSFAQKRFLNDLAGTDSLQESQWGELLRVLEAQVRDFCDLALSNHTPVEIVAYSAGTKTDGNRRIPLLQGALKDTAAYYFDAVGYLYLGQDTAGKTTRNMLLEPSAGIVAKDNTGLLQGPVVASPNLTSLHTLLGERLNQEEGN